jgi:uncharacterized membrane protein
MKKFFLSLFLVIFGSVVSAQAQEYPALFNVTDVPHGDVLNVRSGPGVGNPIIGTLARNATGVEVVGVNETRRWARVSMGESSGWSSTRFLTRTGPSWEQGLPAPLYCQGTEPFWSYERLIGGGNWSDFQVQDQPYAELWAGSAAGRGPSMFAVELDSGASTMTAFIRRGICSDGMSDRDYGLIAQFVRRAGGQTVLLDGCCSLSR